MPPDDEANDGFDCPVCGETFETDAERDKHLTQNHPD